jgi:hypothetical protein
MRDDWGVVKGIIFVLVFLPATVSAQLLQGIPHSPVGPTVTSGDRVPEDVYIMPWIAAGVVYDDNVTFARQGSRREDVFFRVTPGLQASYQSTAFTIVGNYRFDSEVYSKLDELNSAQQRQFGTVETRWRPSSNWTIGNTLGYAQTNTPFELNILTSAQAGRFRAERYFLNPTVEYRVDPSTKLLGQYSYAMDNFGAVDINSHIVNTGVERRVGTHDRLGAAYLMRYFTFNVGPGGSPIGFIGNDTSPFLSHAILATWGHDFSADTRFELRAGPRTNDGRLSDRPEVFADLRRRIPQGEVGLSYLSTVTTIIGTVGAAQTDSLTVSARYEPVKHFTVTVSPAVRWISSDTFDATIYTGYIEAAYQFNKYVVAKASAYFTYQDREREIIEMGIPLVDNAVINRNVYWLRLEFTYPSRWD